MYSHKILAVIGAWMTFATVAHAGAIVVAGEYANQDAPLNNTIPFGYENYRYQQISPSSAFNGPVTLIGIAFRRDVTYFSAASNSYDIQLDLSTTPVSGLNASKTFAANLGATATTVFQGTKQVSLFGPIPAGGVPDFDIVLPFQTGYVYDPAQGNLLFDLQIGAKANNSYFPPLDAYYASNLSSARIYGPAGATAEGRDNFSLVVQFLSPDSIGPAPTGVPEPGSVWLTAGVAVAWLALRRGRNGRGNS